MNDKFLKSRNVDQISSDVFDLIVIGGGINGTGIARDASLRGLKVLLLEKEDFGSGCTSAPTRLIHGGLRYLEHLELPLVYESLSERELLLKNASHLVKPLKFSIPVYKDDKRPLFVVKMGMLLYDLLSYSKSLPNHKSFKRDFLEENPFVSPDGLVGAVTYYDAQVDFPERLCVENVLSSSPTLTSLNHVKVLGFNFSNGSINSLDCKDLLLGKEFKVRGKVVLNASGPWLDEVLSELNLNDRLLGGTKGSHIVVKKMDGGPKNAIYFSATDNRPFFVVPWLDYYLIGTTDIEYEGDLDSVKCSSDEVEYLIAQFNKVSSEIKITKEDIEFSYSGVRPLPHEPNKSPAEKTRKHLIVDHSKDGINNLLSIVGGKLTTYRSLSEEVVDYVLKKKTRLSFVPSATKKTPLIKSKSGNENIESQVMHSIKCEKAFTLSDVMLRRVFAPFIDAPEDIVECTLNLLKEEYGYSQEQLDSQLLDYKKKVSLMRVN